METKTDYPLMNTNEVDYIVQNCNKDKPLFEWGSGHSTVFFSKYFKTVNSVEHDSYWWNVTGKRLVKNKIKNVKLIFQAADLDYRIWENKHSRLLDNRVKEFASYIKAIDGFDEKKYDFFIIDGRARVECSEYALRYCHEDSVVYFQEFHRPRYNQALEWYDLERTVGTMAVLRPKKECLNFSPLHTLRRP